MNQWKARRSGHDLQRSSADHRTPYERDRTRLIHSAAFRRLQRKTQIFGTHEGDFHRTRLTHSLEVDSIARSLVKNLTRFILTHKDTDAQTELLSLLPEDDLITAIALSHDIGHPPFGHGGESALNHMMHDFGGFESNGQTLRLLTQLENSYRPFGLDLTRRTLLGIIKYPMAYSQLIGYIDPSAWVPPKCYMDDEQLEVDWILAPLSQSDKTLFQTCHHAQTLYHSLDCSIMNIADDIAYGIHDLEDAIHLKLIFQEHMDIQKLAALFQQAFSQNTTSFIDAHALLSQLFHPDAAERKQAISELVNAFITSVLLTVSNPDFEEPLLRYHATLPDAMIDLLTHFKTVVFDHVINSPKARVTEHGGQAVIQYIFKAFISNPEQLLSLAFREHYQQALTPQSQMRVICDYIASMTDEYARDMHVHLLGFHR